MIIREDASGYLAVGQPSHAWISGQLARAWGNDRFAGPSPREEVCLAAEQHDLGMAGFDVHPTLNPDTGRPRSFMEMPIETHLEIWETAPRRMLAQDRYAALLVSMHGTALHSRRNPESLAAVDVDRLRGFFEGQEALQERLLQTLRADPRTAPYADDDVVRRNQKLVWVVDSLSLALLLDWAPIALEEAPAREGFERLELSAAEDGRLSVDPWPFSGESLTVRCEGRRMSGRFDEEERMHEALERAPWETIEFELVAPQLFAGRV